MNNLVTWRFRRAGLGTIDRKGSLDTIINLLESEAIIVYVFDHHPKSARLSWWRISSATLPGRPKARLSSLWRAVRRLSRRPAGGNRTGRMSCGLKIRFRPLNAKTLVKQSSRPRALLTLQSNEWCCGTPTNGSGITNAGGAERMIWILLLIPGKPTMTMMAKIVAFLSAFFSGPGFRPQS